MRALLAKAFWRINSHSNAKIAHRLKAKQIALEDFFVFRQPVQALAEKIEILVLTLPLNNETKGIIDENLISNSTQKLVIVNTSRALIVNQNSLISLLEKNKIFFN